jgi:hypothetical protein
MMSTNAGRTGRLLKQSRRNRCRGARKKEASVEIDISQFMELV